MELVIGTIIILFIVSLQWAVLHNQIFDLNKNIQDFFLSKKKRQKITETSNMTKYILIGDYVRSHDGDLHYISANKLLQLYNLKKEECILVEHGLKDKLIGFARQGDYKFLYPRQDGRYEIKNNK